MLFCYIPLFGGRIQSYFFSSCLVPSLLFVYLDAESTVEKAPRVWEPTFGLNLQVALFQVGISPESWAELDTNWQKVAAQV
jgi:hypothetical protein